MRKMKLNMNKVQKIFTLKILMNILSTKKGLLIEINHNG